MSIFGRFGGCDCALQLTSTVATVVVPSQGDGQQWYEQVELPSGAVRPRLLGTNLDPTVLTSVLQELADAVPRRVNAVTLVLPDACAKVHVVPIESEQAPGRRATDEIIRWAFRDTLPFPAEEAGEREVGCGLGPRRRRRARGCENGVRGSERNRISG